MPERAGKSANQESISTIIAQAMRYKGEILRQIKQAKQRRHNSRKTRHRNWRSR